jgi:hypothetical protein
MCSKQPVPCSWPPARSSRNFCLHNSNLYNGVGVRPLAPSSATWMQSRLYQVHCNTAYLQKPLPSGHRLRYTKRTSGPRTTSHNKRGRLRVRVQDRLNDHKKQTIRPWCHLTVGLQSLGLLQLYSNNTRASDSSSRTKTRYKHTTLLHSHEPADMHFYVSKILGALLWLRNGRYRSTCLRLYSEFF